MGRCRRRVPTLEQDHYMADDIEQVAAAIGTGKFLAALDGTGIQLR